MTPLDLPVSELPVLHGSVTNSGTCALIVKGENLILFLFLLIKGWRLTPWKSWKNYYHQLCVAKCCFSSLSSSVIFTVTHFFITLALLWTYVFEALFSLPVNRLQNEVIWFFFKWNNMFQVSPVQMGLCSCHASCGTSIIASTRVCNRSRSFCASSPHMQRIWCCNKDFCWKHLSSLEQTHFADSLALCRG